MNKDILRGLILAAAILIAAEALKLAQHAQWITGDTSQRIIEAIMGLIVAFLGNAIPKNISPRAAHTRMRVALRISGWAFTLAGLAYAGLALFGPSDAAMTYAMAAVATAVLTTFAAVAWGCTGTRVSSSD